MSTSFVPAVRLNGGPSVLASLPAPAPLQLQPIGSLALWQARRVHLHIEAHIAQPLKVDALARVANLSSSHFCRAFKLTFGVTVHRYVLHRRIGKAQHLMLTTSEALSEIAVSCGMSDQSHLTRWFRRVVGVPPAAWRRGVSTPLKEIESDQSRNHHGEHAPGASQCGRCTLGA